jgi:Xaa-Pro aminopeptidase
VAGPGSASRRPRKSSTCDSPLDALRLVKDEHELKLMRRAAEISAGAHRRAMENTRAGWYEYQVEAELVHEFLRHGAQAVAYPSIVAGGPERVRPPLPRQQPATAGKRAAANRRRL